jgi:hypothetical protein
MSNVYEHTQKGNPWIYWGISLLGSVLMLAAVFIAVKAAAEKTNTSYVDTLLKCKIVLIAVAALIWTGFLMSRLKVWIDREVLHIRFGSGIIKKRFALDKIQSAAPVRNTWYMGFGVHYFGNGWLYNIAGLDAVELTFKNGKKARIGTDEPEKLAAAIQTAIRS